MNIETIPVDPALKGIVSSIVLRKSPHMNKEYRALIPSNMGIIACYFGDAIQEIVGERIELLDTPTFFGLQTHPRFFQDSQPYEAVLIYLTPYGLAALAGKEAPKLVDKSIIQPDFLKDWFRPWGLNDPNFAELPLYKKGQLIQQKLVSFLANHRAPDILKTSVDIIAKAHGNLSIRDLCRQLDLTRQGLAYFGKRYVGISLKVYTRIERLNYALDLIQKGLSWEEIIEECGFFDYSHLTKEIKAFSNMKVAEIKEILTLDNSDITRFFKKQVNCHFFYLSDKAQLK